MLIEVLMLYYVYFLNLLNQMHANNKHIQYVHFLHYQKIHIKPSAFRIVFDTATSKWNVQLADKV